MNFILEVKNMFITERYSNCLYSTVCTNCIFNGFLNKLIDLDQKKVFLAIEPSVN